MNERQKQILNIIQGQFPIERYPFTFLARQLGTEEVEVIDQVRQLKQEGIIRYIGPVFDAGRLEYVSTLVAAQVPEEKIEAFVEAVNAMGGVSHNYRRAHDYNIWFTLTMVSREAIEDTIERLRRTFEIPAIYSLPAEKMYKIKVHFNFETVSPSSAERITGRQVSESSSAATTETRAVSMAEGQKALVRELQRDMPLVSAPFTAIAEAVDEDVDGVLQQIREWIAAGVIRRFGARIRHGKAGFKANGMVVFEVEPERLDEAGELLAGYREVSHCYHRGPAPNWRYNLFAMTHSRNPEELQRIAGDMVEKVRPVSHDILLSIKEYKKSSVKYFQEEHL